MCWRGRHDVMLDSVSGTDPLLARDTLMLELEMMAPGPLTSIDVFSALNPHKRRTQKSEEVPRREKIIAHPATRLTLPSDVRNIALPALPSTDGILLHPPYLRQAKSRSQLFKC